MRPGFAKGFMIGAAMVTPFWLLMAWTGIKTVHWVSSLEHQNTTLQQQVQQQSEVLQASKTRIQQDTKQLESKSMALKQEKRVATVSRHIGLLKFTPGKWMSFKATWYNVGGINGNGITAMGTRVKGNLTAAVDPRVIPLGSIIQVKFQNGDTKVLQALDTGGAIKGHDIDIWVPSMKQARKNGVQPVQVRILKRG